MNDIQIFRDAISPSKVEYWKGDETYRNFGDYITEYFVEKAVLGPRIRASLYRLLGSAIDPLNMSKDIDAIKDGGNIAYWGCGAREAERIPPELLDRCEFYGVRGPLTRDLLGLAPDVVMGDPGLLLPLLRKPATGEARHGQRLCVPHFYEPKSDEALRAFTGADAVIRPNIADSLDAFEALVDDISGASFVLAGAMHAAIVAYAYGVPFAFFDAGYVDIPFKWRDFAASIDVPPMFARTVDEGVRFHEQFVAPKATRLRLLPILEECPFYVRPSVILAALDHDRGKASNAEILSALKRTRIESKTYTRAAAASEHRRDERLRSAADKLVALQDAAAQTALRELDEANQLNLENAARTRGELDETLAHLAAERDKTAELEEQRRQQDEAFGEITQDRDRWEATASRTKDELKRAEDELERANGRLEAANAQRSAEAAVARAQHVAAESLASALRTELSTRDNELEARAAALKALHGEHDQLRREIEEAHRERRLAVDEQASLKNRLKATQDGMAQLRAPAGRGELFDSLMAVPAAEDAFAKLLSVLLARPALEAARRGARAKDWKGAEQNYAKLLRIDPARARAWVQYGHALKEQARMVEATMAYRQADLIEPFNPDTLQHLNNGLERCGLPRAPASEPSARAADLMGGNAPTWLHRTAGLNPQRSIAIRKARSLARQHEWRKAADQYQRAVKLAPWDARAWMQLGHALKESGASAAAEPAYRRALNLLPDSADAHLQLGHLLKILERSNEAQAAYVQAFQLAPSSVAARRELEGFGLRSADLVALVLSAEHRPKVQVTPGLDAALGLRAARAAARRRDWKAAGRLYRDLVAKAPGAPKIWIQLGHALKEGGDLPEAEGAYLQALALAPESADTHLQLGHLLKLRGRREEAVEAYQRAYRLNPGLTYAREELDRYGSEPAAPSPRIHREPRDQLGDAHAAPPPAVQSPHEYVVPTRYREPDGLTPRQSSTWAELSAALTAALED